MKILTIAALAATLLLPIAAQDKAPEPNKLTPDQVAKWASINERMRAAQIAADKAALRLAKLEAEEANYRVVAEANMTLKAMQDEAKCPLCIPQQQPDGSLVWPKPVEKAEAKGPSVLSRIFKGEHKEAK